MPTMKRVVARTKQTGICAGRRASLRRLEYPPIHAVRHVQRPIRPDGDAVRLAERDIRGQASRLALPLLARSRDAVDGAVLRSVLADAVVVRVRDEHVAGWVDPEVLGAI